MTLRARYLLILALAAAAGPARANTAVEPAPRHPAWVRRHEAFLAEADRVHCDVVFLGDSITDFWRHSSWNGAPRGRAVWDRCFAPLRALNLGISGDRTQNILWRMGHGELDGLHPRAVVLLIGTNNAVSTPKIDGFVRNSAGEIAEGISAIVRDLRARLPGARILLLGIFPRDRKGDATRAEVGEVNARLARIDFGPAVRYLDIGRIFLAGDGSVRPDLMPDLLHPNADGYEAWAEAIRKPLADLMAPGKAP